MSNKGGADAEAPHTLAGWLVQHLQASASQPNRGVVQLGMRKREIADHLGLNPETLSRMLRSLTRQGVIDVVGYTVQVNDAAALRVLAAASPSPPPSISN